MGLSPIASTKTSPHYFGPAKISSCQESSVEYRKTMRADNCFQAPTGDPFPGFFTSSKAIHIARFRLKKVNLP